MNECLYCGKSVKNKYCNVSCQNKHQNESRNNKKYGEIKKFKVKCLKCGIDFEIEEREKLHPQKEKYYCSRNCANSRNFNDETKEKIGKSILKFFYGENHVNVKKEKLIKETKNVTCECGINFTYNSKRKRKYCSIECRNKYTLTKEKLSEYGKIGGRKSVQSQNRRSKNEIYLSELCLNDFKNVRLNEQIFNGWDADIILDDYKLAILWNGNWHHKKLSKNHSLKQVQNRDKIKIKEIINYGYEPYIINDYGKYNKEFVEKEFEKLKNKIFLIQK